MFNKLLEKNNIEYKWQKYNDNVSIYKIKNKINIVKMDKNSSTFSIDRDLFYYLRNQKLIYTFLLVNTNHDKNYYLEFSSKNNWLRSSFNNCDKNELYFGKIVLNNENNMKNIIDKIQKY